ncbi:MAG: hypothetical protein R3E66_09695 [bacterium]
MSETPDPWQGDTSQRKRAVRFGVAVVAVVLGMSILIVVSRYYGW